MLFFPKYFTIPTLQYSGLSAPQTSPLRGAPKPAPLVGFYFLTGYAPVTSSVHPEVTQDIEPLNGFEGIQFSERKRFPLGSRPSGKRKMEST